MKINKPQTTLNKLLGPGLLLAALALAPLSNALNVSGTNGGFYYGGWVNKGTLNFTFSTSQAGYCKVTWGNISDGGGGKGWKPGSNSRVINYQAGYSSTYNNFGGYGFAPYPTYEMYVQERVTSQSAGSSTLKGSVNSDGGTYKVYLGTQASYSGGGKQYVSKRTSNTSTSGTCKLSTQNHINYWNSKGMTHGTWDSWTLNVEQYGTNVSGSYSSNIW